MAEPDPVKPRSGPLVITDVYEVAKLLLVGTIVRHRDGSICVVEGFDITQAIKTMPMRLRRVATGDSFAASMPELTGILVPIEPPTPPTPEIVGNKVAQ